MSGASLRPVLRAALLAVADAGRVERGADHLVAVAREVLDAAAADEHHRVLLEVVPLARNVGPDLHAVREPDASDLPKRRIRLLRGLRHHARADAPLLRRPLEVGRLRLRLDGLPTLPDELIHGGHASFLEFLLRSADSGRRRYGLPTGTRHGSQAGGERQTDRKPASEAASSLRESPSTHHVLRLSKHGFPGEHDYSESLGEGA